MTYPFSHHPCFSDSRDDLWARIHVPVAPVCNVKCGFCTHGFGSSCHTSKPGYSSRLMSVDEAVSRVEEELARMPNLRIVAVSGPGEPLANHQTMELLDRVREIEPDIKFCLSTNGTLLADKVPRLVSLGVSTISVSVSAISSSVAAQVYEWARFEGERIRGIAMGQKIIERQLHGIRSASRAGLTVKVNTILIPSINTNDIVPLAQAIAEAGASLQNIVPLVPSGNMASLRPPTPEELEMVRTRARQFIPQFTHCQQCRSDVVGIPGFDRVL
ncbi:MAG: radical SAM protein [Candidatus Thorarchaeota archaeon]